MLPLLLLAKLTSKTLLFKLSLNVSIQRVCFKRERDRLIKMGRQSPSMLCTRMLLDNKDDKNDNIIAMTVVAIAFPDNLTKHMFNDDNLGMYDVRKIANAVNSSVAAKMKELEIKHCNRK